MAHETRVNRIQEEIMPESLDHLRSTLCSLRWRFFSALILLTALAINIIPAQEGRDTSQRAPVPKALGDPRSIQISSAVGAVSDRIPIEVSPGRRNVQPHLFLNYSSMAGQGIVGLGWDLEIGKVARWRGDGTPTVGDPDAFAYVLAGAGGELRHAGNGVYRARLETLYREFRRSGNGWEMRDGEGSLHTFGVTTDTRIDDQVWMLERAEDRNGNTIHFNWTKIDGTLYPSVISYTGYAPTGDTGANQVVFEYENRPDARILLVNLVEEQRTLRLRRISVLAGTRLVRRYEFSYRNSPLNGQSLLSRVTLVGADDSSRIILRNLEYEARQAGWSGPIKSGTLPLDLADSEGRETGAKVIDVNGDGFADIIGNGQDVYLGDGQGQFAQNSTWSASLAAASVSFVNGDGADQGVRLIDVDGDLRPDLLVATTSRLEVLLNTGLGWASSSQWSASLQSISQQAIALTDLNFMSSISGCTPPHCGGLLGDFPNCTPPHCQGTSADPPNCIPPHCAPGQTANCSPAHCTDQVSFGQLTREPFSLVEDDGDPKGVQLVDVNGDGRLDIVWSMSRRLDLFWMLSRTPVYVRGVFLNTGSGWTRDDTLTDGLTAFAGEFVSESQLQGYDLLDINGDGLADIVRTLGGAAREVYLGNGRAWTKDTAYSDSLEASQVYSLDGDRKGQGLIPADFDDDGLADYLRANESTTLAYHNTGRGLELSSGMGSVLSAHGIAFSTSDGKSTGTVLADVDGDGLSDIIVARNSNRWLRLSSGMRSDLLVRATGALGEETSLAWAISTSFNNAGANGIQQLPSAMPVATSITRNNGRGGICTTTYQYGGGLYEDRQFRSFARSVESLPSGFRVDRKFFQQEGLAGQFFEEAGYDGQKRLRTKRASEFEIVTSSSPITQFRRAKTTEEAIDPGGTRCSQSLMSYDDRLNVLSVQRDPEVTKSDDDSTTYFSWVLNDDAGIWSLPSRIRTLGPGGSLLTESTTTYDGMPFGQADRGLPDKVSEMVEPGTYVTRQMQYDRYGNLVQVTDRAGGVGRFDYGDPTHTFRTWAADAEGKEMRSNYDARFGEIIRDVDASGNVTTREYDTFGRLSRLLLPGDESSPSGTRTYLYSPLGDPNAQYYRVLETETPGNPETLETTNYFDSTALIYRVEREATGGRMVVTLTEFDDAGNTVLTSRPFFEGSTPVFSAIERDQMHRPTRVVEPDGIELTMSYAGYKVDVVDRRGKRTSFERNADGQVTAIHQWNKGAEQVARYGYDVLGHLVSIVDALGSQTRVAYDALGRRVRLEDPNAGSYHYDYDGEGRLTTQVAPDGSITRFVYDGAGDLTVKQLPDGTEHRFTYGSLADRNAAGRIVRIEDAAGSVTMAYDVRGNVVERRRTVLDRTYVTAYSFDSMGRLRRLTYPDGFTVNYEYDAGGNIGRLVDGQGRVLAGGFDYNPAGQLNGMEYGNGVRSSFDYDQLLRMTSIRTLTSAGERLQELGYDYDPEGNILSITDAAFGSSQQFEYDDLGRLIQAKGSYGREIYDYDAIGNLLRKGTMVFSVDPAHPQRAVCGVDVSAFPGKSTGIAGNPRYQGCIDALVAYAKQGDLKTPSGGNGGNPNLPAFTISYDERGNTIEKGDRGFEYDSENRLVRVFSKTGKLLEENVYDAGGQRLIQRTPQDTTIFIDGIYEENSTHASRHVRTANLVVATVVTPRATVRLIAEAPPAMLAGNVSMWGSFLRHTSCRPLLSLLSLMLGVVSIGLAINRLRRQGALASGIAGAWTTIRLNPARAAITIMLIPAVAMAGVGSPPSGGPTPVSQQGKFQSEVIYYYHSNHLGSVNVVTDDRGEVIARHDYRPYGDPFDWSGASGGPRELMLTFDGQRYSDSTGYYHFGARNYDPQTGRFLTADTQVPDPMNPKSLHRYAFAGGNPIRNVDPSGHAWYDFLIAAFVILAAIVITIVTFGALAGVGVMLFTIGAGLIAAAVALSQGLNPLSEEFWQAVVTGMVLGAVIGAGIFALPTMLSSSALWIETITSMALVGAATGAIESTIVQFASGGSADGLLRELLIGIGIGFAIGAAGGALSGGLSALRELGRVGQFLAKLIKPIKTVISALGALAKGESIVYGAIASLITGEKQYFMRDVIGYLYPSAGDLWSFFSSPRHETGVPAWIFSSTWPGLVGGTGSRSGNNALQTMPLAP
jgi:RHS repeat-associated protein